MWKCGYRYLSYEKLHKICQLVPTLQIREQLVNICFFFLQLAAVSECVHTFSMDIELRNDRIPRNPFDRQFLDMYRDDGSRDDGSKGDLRGDDGLATLTCIGSKGCCDPQNKGCSCRSGKSCKCKKSAQFFVTLALMYELQRSF